ncbi:aldo/keto reductase [Kamptonema cortianum]|nr:aldo/keto reductase [Kamptonema cortianum]
MDKRPFGKTGFDSSVISFGAMRLINPETSTPTLLHALERGINMIDTARAYGNSEELVGKALKEWRGQRPFIATKVFPNPGNWRNFVPLEEAYTPAGIIDSVETSLRELRVDQIDLLQLHQWYYLWTHRPEWLDTFRKLREQGKIRFWGISAQDHEHDAALQVVDMGLVDSVQIILNLFESRPLEAFIPLCGQKQTAIIARCVLDAGGISDSHTVDSLRKIPYFKGFEKVYAERLVILKERFGKYADTLPELAIRFALTHPAVSTLAMGMGSARSIDASIAAAEKGPLPQDVFEDINENYRWVKNFYQHGKF